MADFKDEISPAMVTALAGELHRAWDGFPTTAFTADAAGLAPLALLARVRHVAAALGRAMPGDFAAAATVLHRALDSASFTGWMTLPCGYYVAEYGLDAPDVALPALAALSPRFSSEGPIRYFIERHPRATFDQLRRWAADPDEHLRRLVSEGTRPRLPWAPQLRGLVADPTPAVALLDRLHDDPSEYVRRSVANHLNDISRDHPDLAVSIARRWAGTGGDRTAWVIRHGLRTLAKQGHPGALRLLGYDLDIPVTLTGLTVTPASVPIGGEVTIAFTLVADTTARAVVDYAVHHAGVRGTRAPKVFKLTTVTLQGGRARSVSRRHPFREVSVRRLHPGQHRIDIQINGRILGSTEVRLTGPGE
ncbi:MULTISPECIES: DNA alkylation repair protein [unclassified Micromonospora]|uniref:DNA alkylation repair protein n=1 Tax=unclassified Micromonospora TaxID=2617518 RepID=UPI00363F92C2